MAIKTMTFTQRTISLSTDQQKQLAIAAIQNVPTGHNLEVVIREVKKQRSLDANSLMWAGPLKDIEAQVWMNNRQYSATIWHEFFKEIYLADEANEPYLHEHVKNPESYRKYDYTPKGQRLLIGSTTDLTKYGFSHYLEQIYAFGAANGVLFHSNPKDIQR